MKYLYLLSQDENNNYYTYDSCVVCASSPERAVKIHPGSADNPDMDHWESRYGTWCKSPDKVICRQIGTASRDIPLNSVVIGSFNAG